MDTGELPGQKGNDSPVVANNESNNADEIDEADTTMTFDDPIWEMLNEPFDDGRSNPFPDRSPNISANPPKPPARPILRRDGSTSLPPQQPPPPAPTQQEDPSNPTDSLSLAQLKRLVTDLPKLESTAYAYTYEDTRSFPEELNEWFQYTEEDKHLLLNARTTFERKWQRFQATDSDSAGVGRGWTDVEDAARERFVDSQLEDLMSLDVLTRLTNLEALTYVALGAWADTAGLPDLDDSSRNHLSNIRSVDVADAKTELQIKWIWNAAHLLRKAGAVTVLYELMKMGLENEKAYDVAYKQYDLATTAKVAADEAAKQQELGNVLTILYLVVEVGRQQAAAGEDATIQQEIAALRPSLLKFLSQLIARLRWDDTSNIPLTRILLLFWKTILLVFGGTKQLKHSKYVLRDESEQSDNEQGEGFITASPLDYHLFRQEITSKYPAYNPPPPLVPLELENNSILPPLPSHPSRNVGQDSQISGPGASVNGIGRSIFHQPVHIATPAPSPPPSPVGPGGKGGKKQNYQTNQNFPFLYPPLDDTSNTVGGKGNAGLQDKLVGKKWEGSDVPASILEAGQLFASRMRMSRSTRQLWDVREKFMTFERGWGNSNNKQDTPGIELESLRLEDEDVDEGRDNNDSVRGSTDESDHPGETKNEDIQSRLDAVEDFYRNSLPHLQSIVIVLLKIVLANVTALAAQMNGQNGNPNSFSFPENRSDAELSKPKSNVNLANQLNPMANGNHSENENVGDPALEELNAVRLREITSKAIAGIFLMLLKWFKLSHILKYEYLCQLLLDSNYLPLALKLFAHQDVDRAVDLNNDREDMDFFHLCQIHSKNPPSPPAPRHSSSSSSSSDEAAPPPIQRHRRSPTSNSPPPSPGSPPSPPPRPEVDELGYPTTVLPQSPLTNYSSRFFYTTITHLRLLQKITKRKAHRALLLVQYKSSTILRKALKIPQPDLRLYTLKLFKSQVPYCGRKWRQSNMRVITAIYLHCRPELRDEWLAGGDVDGVVEEAVPLEQAGRSLVHWWHLRAYREVMEGEVGGVGKEKEKGKRGGVEDEDDFFARELERMGWGVEGGFGGEEELLGEEDTRPGNESIDWEGGPLQSEGW